MLLLSRISGRHLLKRDSIVSGSSGNVEMTVYNGDCAGAPMPDSSQRGATPLRKLRVAQQPGCRVHQREVFDQNSRGVDSAKR